MVGEEVVITASRGCRVRKLPANRTFMKSVQSIDDEDLKTIEEKVINF